MIFKKNKANFNIYKLFLLNKIFIYNLKITNSSKNKFNFLFFESKRLFILKVDKI
jgi:hypothetical protein